MALRSDLRRFKHTFPYPTEDGIRRQHTIRAVVADGRH